MNLRSWLSDLLGILYVWVNGTQQPQSSGLEFLGGITTAYDPVTNRNQLTIATAADQNAIQLALPAISAANEVDQGQSYTYTDTGNVLVTAGITVTPQVATDHVLFELINDNTGTLLKLRATGAVCSASFAVIDAGPPGTVNAYRIRATNQNGSNTVAVAAGEGWIMITNRVG